MDEIFLNRIKIDESRNLRNFEIPISTSERKHLIITGKNGSGKTSLLLDINNLLQRFVNGEYKNYDQNLITLRNHEKRFVEIKKLDDSTPNKKQQLRQINQTIKDYQNWFKQYPKIEMNFSNKELLFDSLEEGKFLVSFFDAKRQSALTVPSGIKKFDLKKKYNISEKANQNFIQYIVNLKAERSFARDDNDMETVKEIDIWFNRFEERLKNIFDAPDLELIFDRKNYNFQIKEGDKIPYTFNTLSDGYSAIISIVTEFILRMEGQNSKSYDLEGVVLIDEIETHLHVELQKKVLPFLTDFFPKIQFIVTTHSPFILSSVANAVVCDLESRLVTTDLSGYSYDALIESYFNTDKYSEEIKSKILEFEKLSSKSDLDAKAKNDLQSLRNYFAHVPKYLSKELMVKLQQIELNNLNKKVK